MKVGVVGSRRFNDYTLLKKVLNTYSYNHNKISMIISGGAKGADSLGQKYAKEYGLPILIRYPNWDRFGKKAGFVRNILIAQDCAEPEGGVMFAFPMYDSRGTWHVMNKGKQFGVKIYVVETIENGSIKTYTIN